MSDALLAEAVQRHRAGDEAGAERLYKAVLAREPKRFDALYRLGFLYGQRGAFADAERTMGEAIALNPASADAQFLRGSALLKLKRDAEAVACLDCAVALDPKLAPAWFNRAVGLAAMQRYAEALASAERSLALAPHANAEVTKAVALNALGRREEAKAAYDRALALDPRCIDALVNRATMASEDRRYEDAAADCEAALALNPSYEYLRGFLLFFRLNGCDWRDYEAQRDAILDAGEGSRVIQPLMNLAISDSPVQQLRCARVWAESECAALGMPLWRGERYRHEKIRVAYVSEDFRTHPVAQAITPVLERHDRRRFEITAVSLGPDDGSALRARIAKAAGRFIDAAGQSDAAIAALLRRAETDIAVDMMGFTGSGRSTVFGRRPAPVQVNFLGFAGTTGAPHMDYLIADAVAIPQGAHPHYSEKIVCLPDSFFPAEPILLPEPPARAEAGVPEDAFVFAAFNNPYKIAPDMFRLWMRLLARVEGSVLWLGKANASAMRNLGREAAAAGIGSDRLIFAPYLPSRDAYLARLSLADVFLDTWPQNAHSTAADALWAGVPVLTCAGRTFAGRVAASLLHAVGLPELIAHSLDEYESLALCLAREASVLSDIRAKLVRNRTVRPLFDPARFTRHLESAYDAMLARAHEGLPPASFAVPHLGGDP
jgi:protein O-GlcNAc transferase